MDGEDVWQDLVFYPGEDEAALITRFVELRAKYKNNYTPTEVAQYVFSGLKEPSRAIQAAAKWDVLLEVKERIRLLELKNPEIADATKSDLISRSITLADDTRLEARDRLAAIRLAGELQGMIIKSAEVKAPGSNDNAEKTELLAAIAEKLRA